MFLESLFNMNNGYLEGLLRGFKCGILKQNDYFNLVQCETLEGISIYSPLIISYASRLLLLVIRPSY